MADLFNNPYNNYVDPGFSPCVGTPDDMYLEFLPDGEIGVVSGQGILSSISFDDKRIPLDSYNRESKLLGPGEVHFVQGLSKGLSFRTQVFDIINLYSNNINLEPYFMKVDLSVGYYKDFEYKTVNIEASSNYTNDLKIDDELDKAFGKVSAPVDATYDPSSFTFTGTTKGLDFFVSNVVLTLIDASENSMSPFEPVIINGVRQDIMFTLTEDVSARVPFAKYANTAMKGIVMKGKYPAEVSGSTLSESDKWLYLNHVPDYIYDCSIYTVNNFIDDVSLNFVQWFDPSVSVGVSKPTCDVSSMYLDASDNVFSVDSYGNLFIDLSIGELSLSDPSIGTFSLDISLLYDASNLLIDGSVFSNTNVTNSTILDSTVSESSIGDSSIGVSNLTFPIVLGLVPGNVDTSVFTSFINDSYVEGVWIQSSIVNNSEITLSTIYDSYCTSSNISYSDASYAGIVDSSMVYTFISDSSVLRIDSSGGSFSRSYIEDSSVSDASISETTVDGTVVRDSSLNGSNIENSELWNSRFYDTYCSSSYVFGSDVSIGSFVDSSLVSTNVANSSLLRIDSSGGDFGSTSIEDSSIGGATLTMNKIRNTYLNNSSMNKTVTDRSNLVDVSICGNSLLTNDTSVIRGYMNNSLANIYVLIVNPSTGETIYVYDDASIDSQSNTVYMEDVDVWDSSLNNVELVDCSVYRSYVYDASASGCTFYNCDLDPSLYVALADSNRIVMIDPSLACETTISYDSSVFYTKTKRKVTVGLTGCSTEPEISGNDYLKWITDNDMWKKFSDIYIWTTVPDVDTLSTENLIEGFYLYNPHAFNVKVDYLTFS